VDGHALFLPGLLANLLGASYDELDSDGGHMWMLSEHARFAAALA
jgi:hypothetical protein